MKNLFDQIKLLFEQELYSNVVRICSLAVTVCSNDQILIAPQQKCNMYLYYAESLFNLEQYAKAENIYYQAFQQRKNIIKKKSGGKPQENNKEFMSDVDIKFKIHLCYVKLKQYQKAICILQSISARSRNAKINMALGNLYRDSGMERSAISAYKEVLRESPLALEAAESLLALGVKGIEVNSLMLEGTSDSVTTSWVKYWLKGQAEMHSGDYKTAIPTFIGMESSGLLKDNVALLVTLGKCYHYSGESKKALHTVQRLVVLHTPHSLPSVKRRYTLFFLWWSARHKLASMNQIDVRKLGGGLSSNESKTFPCCTKIVMNIFA